MRRSYADIPYAFYIGRWPRIGVSNTALTEKVSGRRRLLSVDGLIDLDVGITLRRRSQLGGHSALSIPVGSICSKSWVRMAFRTAYWSAPMIEAYPCSRPLTTIRACSSSARPRLV